MACCGWPRAWLPVAPPRTAARTSTARRDAQVSVRLGLFAGLLLNCAPIRRYGGNLSQPRARPVDGGINTDAGNRGRIRLLHWAVEGQHRRAVTVSPHLATRERWVVRASLRGRRLGHKDII